jgi:hypothetical protein
MGAPGPVSRFRADNPCRSSGLLDVVGAFEALIASIGAGAGGRGRSQAGARARGRRERYPAERARLVTGY